MSISVIKSTIMDEDGKLLTIRYGLKETYKNPHEFVCCYELSTELHDRDSKFELYTDNEKPNIGFLNSDRHYVELFFCPFCGGRILFETVEEYTETPEDYQELVRKRRWIKKEVVK